MSNQGLIEDKISSMHRYLAILDHYKSFSAKQIEKDYTLKGAVERYLYLLCQSAIDLSEMLIAYKKLRKPATMSESFEILYDGGVIDADLQEKMIKLTGFRNVLAHDYTKVDYVIVHSVIQSKLQDVVEFMKAAEL